MTDGHDENGEMMHGAWLMVVMMMMIMMMMVVMMMIMMIIIMMVMLVMERQKHGDQMNDRTKQGSLSVVL